MMAEGKDDTPGPFWVDPGWKPGSEVGAGIYRNYGSTVLHAATVSQLGGQAEVDELVGLLNRGTHFDVLMRVVYELLRHPEAKPPFDEAHTVL